MAVISVLMPCYNVASTIDEAISSLVAQTYTNFELVLVDDGSTDATPAHLADWAQRDQRIQVLQLRHVGIIAALNAGLEASHSEYIARMDADDRSTSKRLEQQVALLDSHAEFALVSGLVRGFSEHHLGREFEAYIHWLNSLHTDQDIKYSMFVQSPLAHPSVAYRRDWIERVGRYQDHGWAEDYDLWVRLFLAGASFGKVPEVLLEWRDHPHRLTHTDGRYSNTSDLRLKAYYLANGPLAACSEVVIWGESHLAHALGEQLMDNGCPLSGCVISRPFQSGEPASKIPVINPEQLKRKLYSGQPPIVLVAENDHEIREQIIRQLELIPLHEGIGWWVVASS
jgi:glycosyltransferase involved in cell wall biosynthesis